MRRARPAAGGEGGRLPVPGPDIAVSRCRDGSFGPWLLIEVQALHLLRRDGEGPSIVAATNTPLWQRRRAHARLRRHYNFVAKHTFATGRMILALRPGSTAALRPLPPTGSGTGPVSGSTARHPDDKIDLREYRHSRCRSHGSTRASPGSRTVSTKRGCVRDPHTHFDAKLSRHTRASRRAHAPFIGAARRAAGPTSRRRTSDGVDHRHVLMRRVRSTSFVTGKPGPLGGSRFGTRRRPSVVIVVERALQRLARISRRNASSCQASAISAGSPPRASTRRRSSACPTSAAGSSSRQSRRTSAPRVRPRPGRSRASTVTRITTTSCSGFDADILASSHPEDQSPRNAATSLPLRRRRCEQADDDQRDRILAERDPVLRTSSSNASGVTVSYFDRCRS